MIEFSTKEIDDHLLSSFIYPHLHFTFQEAKTLTSSHLSEGPKAGHNPCGKKTKGGEKKEERKKGKMALGHMFGNFSVNLIYFFLVLNI